MSGVEVVGIALGVLPIVLQSIDAYKDSIRRVGTTIRKRKYVEKLGRALLLQQQILEETVKSIVLACGCENVTALEEDPFGYFGDEDVRERVEDYLGPKNSVAFVGLLIANNDIVKKVAKNISGLVPQQQVRFCVFRFQWQFITLEFYAKHSCRNPQMIWLASSMPIKKRQPYWLTWLLE